MHAGMVKPTFQLSRLIRVDFPFLQQHAHKSSLPP